MMAVNQARELVALRGQGKTHREIAAALKIENPFRVYFLLTRARKWLKRLEKAPDLAGFSYRAMNVLYNNDLRTRGQIESALDSGWLEPGTIHMYGPVVHNEVLLFLGLEELPDPRIRAYSRYLKNHGYVVTKKRGKNVKVKT